jgi:hypothetical protein
MPGGIHAALPKSHGSDLDDWLQAQAEILAEQEKA